MPDKTEKSAAPKVIKWTEEEWASVANHLFEQKGAVLLSSPRLEEIRAKDVFMAQETLPEDRHRKLISIAQGFQGIRDRLSTIFQNMNKVRQDDLFKREQAAAAPENGTANLAPEATAPKAAPAQPSRRSGRDKAPQAAMDAGATEEKQALPQETAVIAPSTETAKAADAANAAETAPAQQVADNNPASAAAVAEPMPEPSVQPQPTAPAQQREANRSFPQQEPAPRRAEQNMAAGGRERPRDRGPEARPQGAWASAQASAGFIEAARPFVAMVCEEMALALVKVMGGKAGEQQLAGIMQKALSQFASGQGNGNGNAGYGSRPERQPRPERQAQTQPQPQPQPFSAPIDAPERAAPDLLDDESSHPAEVQPLFDPKLPPSANSDFKPTIGLVGANTRELDDLQLLYPQLRLTVVAPDAVRSADVFRQCQRIIGLREDVSQPVDELLRRLLRNRYIRIAGGIPRVREQLNSWLHNPGSINAEPRPHVPRGPKGQGQGQGEGGKKRHNRHLRAPR